MDVQKFILNKISKGKKLNSDLELERAICFMVDQVGVEDTFNMSLPLFNAMMNFYEWKNSEEKKAMNKK